MLLSLMLARENFPQLQVLVNDCQFWPSSVNNLIQKQFGLGLPCFSFFVPENYCSIC